jgi:hypothetical protein
MTTMEMSIFLLRLYLLQAMMVLKRSLTINQGSPLLRVLNTIREAPSLGHRNDYYNKCS